MISKFLPLKFLGNKWHLLYFVLAGFDLLAICVTLVVNHLHVSQYSLVVDSNTKTNTILKSAGSLLDLAQKSNAPGNDIFESHNVTGETARYVEANKEFDRGLLMTETLLVDSTLGVQGARSQINEVRDAMTAMRNTADQIFHYFEIRDERKAGVLMAEMDRKYSRLVKSIENIRVTQIERQSHILSEHREKLHDSKNVETLVSLIVLLAVFGVAMYGTRMSHFVKQSALRDAHLAGIVSTSVDSILSVDIDGNILSWNLGAEQMFGYSASEAIGQPLKMLIPEGKQYENLQNISKIKEGASINIPLTTRITKSKKLIDVSISFAPLRDTNGRVVGASEIIRDITEQRKNEMRLSDAQAIAKIGSWEFNLQTHSLLWTSEHYRIFEIEEPQSQEHLYKQYRERIHPEDLKTLDLLVERAKTDGEDFVFNHRLVFESGSRIKHVQGRGKVIKNLAGIPEVVTGTCQDLTELIKTQEENRFVLDTLGIGVWKFNPLTQDLHWDKSMYNLYEMNPVDFSGHYQAWESALTSTGKKKAIEELRLALLGEKEFDTTFEIKSQLGQKKFIGGRARVLRNDRGEPIMMYGINWDRSKEVLDEKKIDQQRVLLESVLENIPNMVFVKDYRDNLRFTLFNRAGEELLGVAAAEVIGKTDYDLFSKEKADFFTSKDKEVFERQKILKIEQETINTPRGLRWLRTFKIPTYNEDGKPNMLIGISTDITEEIEVQKKLEVERAKSVHSAKLASLGEMSAGIAHEINNPLAIIAGNIPLLKKVKDDTIKFELKTDTMSRATDRIAKIVKGLRKFSRSSEGSVHKPELLSGIVNEALIITETKSKRHSTPVEVDMKTQSSILCDGVEIEQVLVNLINNAIDAVKENEKKWIKVIAFDEANEVVVQVMDSGLGISGEIEQKLFQPFFTTKAVGEGTGLGLSISKGILDMHKASLKLNHSFRNTCFEVRFIKADAVGVKNAA